MDTPCAQCGKLDRPMWMSPGETLCNYCLAARLSQLQYQLDSLRTQMCMTSAPRNTIPSTFAPVILAMRELVPNEESARVDPNPPSTLDPDASDDGGNPGR